MRVVRVALVLCVSGLFWRNKMAKYTVIAIVKGTIDRDDTEQAETQLWEREFELTEMVNPEILDVEEVDLCDTGEIGDASERKGGII